MENLEPPSRLLGGNNLYVRNVSDEVAEFLRTTCKERNISLGELINFLAQEHIGGGMPKAKKAATTKKAAAKKPATKLRKAKK